MKSDNLEMTSVEVSSQSSKCNLKLSENLNTYSDADVSSFEIFFLKKTRASNRKNSIKNIFSD